MKESGHQTSIGQKQADKMTQLQTQAMLSRKRKMGRQAAGQGCEPNGSLAGGVSRLLGAGDSLFLLFPPLPFLYLLGCVGSSLWQAGSSISAHRP